MIETNIPGFGRIAIEHLVCDYNGTLACDGKLLPEVASLFKQLSQHAKIHVVTADTFGIAAEQLQDVPCTLTILPKADQDTAKLEYVQALGPEKTICIGNGRNDKLMLEAARIGIAVILAEGACAETTRNADILCTSITDALLLLLNTGRLTATLRS